MNSSAGKLKNPASFLAWALLIDRLALKISEVCPLPPSKCAMPAWVKPRSTSGANSSPTSTVQGASLVCLIGNMQSSALREEGSLNLRPRQHRVPPLRLRSGRALAKNAGMGHPLLYCPAKGWAARRCQTDVG